MRGLVIDGEALTPPTEPWKVKVDGSTFGSSSRQCGRHGSSTNIAIAMLDHRWCTAGTAVEVRTPSRYRYANSRSTTRSLVPHTAEG